MMIVGRCQADPAGPEKTQMREAFRSFLAGPVALQLTTRATGAQLISDRAGEHLVRQQTGR